MADPASIVTEERGSRRNLPKLNLPISIEDRHPPLEITVRPKIAREPEPFEVQGDPFDELVRQSDAATLASLDQPEDHDETITVADGNGEPRSFGVVGVQGSGDEIYIPLSRVDDTQDDAPLPAPPPAEGTAGSYVLDRPLLPGELVANPDGTTASELTVTERDGTGRFMNAPSLWMTDDGIRKLSWRDAVRTAKAYEARTGLRFPRFETAVAGVNAAKMRSAADGVLSGPLAREPGQEVEAAAADDVSILQRFSSAITPRIVHEIGRHLTDAVRGLAISGPVRGALNFNKMFITPTIKLDEAVNLPGGRVLTELNSLADIMDYIGAVTGMDATAPVPGTITGMLAEGLGQMLPAMIPLVNGLKAAGHGAVVSSLVGGWLADVVTTSTTEAEGIVGILKMFPDDWQGEWVQAVDDFIHAAPGGTVEAEVRARLVSGWPGLLIGPVAEVLLPTARLIGKLFVKAKDAGLTKEVADVTKAFMADKSGSVKLPGPAAAAGEIKLTKVEQKFFDDFLGNEANRGELLEAVPSLKIENGKLSVAQQDIDALWRFVDETVILDGPGSVPPRLKKTDFYKKIEADIFNKGMPELEKGPPPDVAPTQAANSPPSGGFFNEGETAAAKASPANLELRLSRKHDVELDLSERPEGIVVSKIVASKPGTLAGTRAMREIIAEADKRGVPVALTPSTAFGGNKKRLVKFYKDLGFVPNKGKNKNFLFRETMIREPKAADASYRMQHQARGPDEGGARLDDMTGGGEVFPDDIYSSQGLRYYGNVNSAHDRESFDVIQSVRGNPEAEVTIYRGVPEGVDTINPGDFVSVSRTYAENHAASGYGPSGKSAGVVLSKKVKVKDVFSDGNDLNEFGYFPEQK